VQNSLSWSRVVPSSDPGFRACAGTVLAAELASRGGGGGYASGEARGVTQALRAAGVYARPLGNVVYLMVTPTTAHATATPLLETLLRVLDEAGTNGER
jgi:dethiobiotin synthetase/adenosylmethionine--8-amino-7-oxononanoate aminotransferase